MEAVTVEGIVENTGQNGVEEAMICRENHLDNGCFIEAVESDTTEV